MSDDPFLSVVVPVFEGEHAARATIEAVQAHSARRGWPIEIRASGYELGLTGSSTRVDLGTELLGVLAAEDRTDAPT